MSFRISTVFAVAGLALLAACAAPMEEPAAAVVAPAIVTAEPVFTGKL